MWVEGPAATGPVFPAGGLPGAMDRRSGIVLLVMLAAFALAGCTIESEYSDEPGPDDRDLDSDRDTVRLRDESFVPDRLSAAVGDTVRFVNEDPVVHTVTAVIAGDDTVRKDVELEPGQETQMSIDRRTDYTVYCRFHGSPEGGMRMVIATS